MHERAARGVTRIIVHRAEPGLLVVLVVVLVVLVLLLLIVLLVLLDVAVVLVHQSPWQAGRPRAPLTTAITADGICFE